MRIYLSGAIEYSPDRGKAWRAQLTPFLTSLGHQVYDPAADERKNLSEEERADFRAWKSTDLPRFQQTVRKIIRWDLDKIERHTDAVVCYWDEHAGRGAGTQAELTFAHRIGVPVYLVCAVPPQQVSGWILGCATELFSGFEPFKLFFAQRGGPERSRSAAVQG
jgi:nucleoside 2-deoxyribosyltransferase